MAKRKKIFRLLNNSSEIVRLNIDGDRVAIKPGQTCETENKDIAESLLKYHNDKISEVKKSQSEESTDEEPVEEESTDEEPVEEESSEEPVRARNEQGQLIGDDPDTPDVNEAWEGGEAPEKTPNYQAMLKSDLILYARDKGISGVSSELKKPEIIELIQSA